ncbi:MAG: hypothetical protein LPD71_04755 [Shewanella sp.]|nr:hypothetical protein [Shewanella sp.]MCF1431853.1 hypothetical protein [Shewanella sp.]MCF1438073.1 hypothetical protein [Shewanella sp.]MCF1457988.1 hypothetical protein [Shewanella sp.]
MNGLTATIESLWAGLFRGKAENTKYAGEQHEQFGIVIARTLALFHEQMHTRMLLANDAYFKGDYAKAIAHWQILLESPRQAINERAINNAILKAQSQAGAVSSG